MKLENMNEFNFKSSVCTSREQSERLLALGLKKETADMCHRTNGMGIYFITAINPLCNPNDIPAWSLGRLLEVMRMKASSQIVPLDDTFDRLIEGIETRIKEGYFNKEYLV